MTTAPSTPLRPSLAASVTELARDIKLSHTVFALPFALFSAVLAAHGVPKLGQLALILACMVTARTFAMAMNRLLDARLDALNPRTARRAIPSGRLSRGFVLGSVILCAALFELATAGFYFLYHNLYPLLLGPFVLVFLGGYPLLKRFTALCHYYLGAALALAPTCAFVAIAAHVTLTPLLLSAAVLTWTAGFDILYAAQDYHSDLATGTFSIPARLGLTRAFWVARFSHAVSATLLLTLPLTNAALGPIYLTGAALAALLLIVEHSLVSPTNLARINLAFFTLNGVISLLIGMLGILDVLF